MLHQHDVAVVDQHLPGEKHHRQGGFANRVSETKRVGNRGGQFRRDGKIGYGDRGGIGRDHAIDAEAEHDHEQRSTQSNPALEHQIRRQAAESVCALDVSSPASQRNIECGADREKYDEHGTGQIQIRSNLPLKQEQQECDEHAACPCAPMEIPVNGALASVGTLLRHDFCGNDLKGERHRGEEREQRVHGRRVSEALADRGVAPPQRCRRS